MKFNLRNTSVFAALLCISTLSFSQTTIISWPFGVNGQSSSSVSGNSGVVLDLTGGGQFYSGVGCGFQEAISNDIDANDYWKTGSFNTTGFTNCKYSFRQMRFNNGPTAFKFQYRLSTSGGWTDIVGPYSTSATSCGGGYIASSVSLPSACDNQSVVQLRWLCTAGRASVNPGGGRLATVSVEGTGSCTDPTVPTLSATSTSICSGSSTTLSIATGTLNDATSWKAYSTSCGSGSAGTFSGTSLTVSPTTTTTYRVRGEGGCVTPGSCGSITITVNNADDASFSYTGSPFCQNGSDPTPTAATAGTYSSTAGLSINGTSGAIDVSASTPGTYTVTHTTTGSCPNTSTTSVTITATDDASFSYTGSPFCQNGSDPTPTAATAGTYSSTAGLSINGTSGAIDVSASTPGTYTVTHTTTGSCPNTSTTSVTITATDDASFSYTGSPFCQNGSDPTPTAATAGTYSSTAGLSINGTSGAIDVSASTPGTYTVTHTTTGSCPNTSTTSVTITATDDASFSYTGSPFCNNDADPSPTAATAGTYSSTAGLSINGTSGAIDVSASTPGTYTITHTTTGSCPNTSTTSVTIKAISFATISPDVCDTYTSPSGKTWTSSGTYMDTIPNDAGCDSIITVNLTVRYSTTSSLTVREFNSYTAPSGAVYTQSAVVNDVITNDAGCDSTITIDIEIVNIVFVDGDKSTSGNGKTWATAHNTIDEAIDSANINPNTVEIWVKKGTYYPGGSQSTTDRKSSFIITNINTLLYGGFVGNETLSSQRNPALNPTILSGNIGSASDSTDNVFHIMLIIDKRAYVSGEAIMDEDFIVDGFTFMDGYAIGPGKDFFEGEDLYQSEGSAIAIISSGSGRVMRPTISNCHFERNTSVYGSIFMGVEQGNSFATINNCTFKSNHATHGAIYNESNFGETSPTIKNCVFEGNISKASGGAIFNYSYTGTSSPTIENCVFIGNTAQTQGAAIYNNGYVGTCKPNIINCTFYGNAATVQAGAIYNFGLSGTLETKITNCVFYKNTKGGISTDRHSELYNYQSTNTINNSSLQNASSLYNSANKNGVNGGTGNVFATYPDFVDTTDFDGADDLFRTADDGLSIKSTSSLVNAGKTAGAPTNDIIGNQRTTTVDIGAYEYITCGLSSPLATSVATHTATQSAVDNGFVCYCNSNNKLLLALDTNGTGAVITPSQVKLYIGNPSTLSYNSAGGMITNTAGGVILERRWDVDPTTQPTSPVRVRYFYTNDEYDDIVTAMAALTSPTTITSPSQLQFYKVTGGSTATFPNPHDAGVTGIVLTNGATATTTVWVNGSHGVQDHTAEYLVSSFSGGGGGGGGGSSPLPVELIQFDAQASANHTAEITWKTASELDNSHFVVERSYNARDFEEVAIVQGNGTTQNTISYSHNDNTIDQTQNLVFYRLRQVDFDGTQAYSPIRRVDFVGDITPNKVSLYPNPTSGQVTVRFEDDEVVTHSVKVIDNLGRELYNNTFEGQAIQLDLSSQATGIYFIILDTGESFKVVKE